MCLFLLPLLLLLLIVASVVFVCVGGPVCALPGSALQQAPVVFPPALAVSHFPSCPSKQQGGIATPLLFSFSLFLLFVRNPSKNEWTQYKRKLGRPSLLFPRAVVSQRVFSLSLAPCPCPCCSCPTKCFFFSLFFFSLPFFLTAAHTHNLLTLLSPPSHPPIRQPTSQAGRQAGRGQRG